MSLVTELVARYGNPMSDALFDANCALFAVPGIEGVIGYREGYRSAVALGDPVCAEQDASTLFDAFGRFRSARRWDCLWACASEQTQRYGLASGYAAIAFGEELIVDPMGNPQEGARGRELRKRSIARSALACACTNIAAATRTWKKKCGLPLLHGWMPVTGCKSSSRRSSSSGCARRDAGSTLGRMVVWSACSRSTDSACAGATCSIIWCKHRTRRKVRASCWWSPASTACAKRGAAMRPLDRRRSPG